MRFIFLIPELRKGQSWSLLQEAIHRFPGDRMANWALRRWLYVDELYGGTMNIMRHCWLARRCGAEAVLATMSGQDTYGDVFGLQRHLPVIPWQERRPEDVCIVPDFVSQLIEDVRGVAIAYQQSPLQIKNDFDYRRQNVILWTDSPLMQAVCQQAYPGKPSIIVPNIVDAELFPFIAQAQREQGLLFAFPRKGAEFIKDTQIAYQQQGGQFWRFELIDGLSITELAQQFRRPQAFLASAVYEGCALPPQEAMAAGIVVVGKTARGANFCMEKSHTALTGETPAEVAQCLLSLEQAELRDQLSQNAYTYIQQYFPDHLPTQFWQKNIATFVPNPIAV